MREHFKYPIHEIQKGSLIPLQRLPYYLANSWRMKASNQMVLCTFYLVTYMRHTSNLELAVDFAPVVVEFLSQHAEQRVRLGQAVVELEGARTLIPSCSRKAEEGMKIRTDSERVRLSRKLVLELPAVWLASRADEPKAGEPKPAPARKPWTTSKVVGSPEPPPASRRS